jgi:ribosomal protein L11 methyltransferase
MATENIKEESNSPRWLTATITLNPILEEAVVDFLVGVMAGAVEQTVDDNSQDLTLTIYFEKKNQDKQLRASLQKKVKDHLIELADIFQVELPEISWDFIEDQDWSSNWKVHFKPFAITRGLTIVPTWEEYQPGENEQVITMDPGMAFGTGHHATTSMSLDFLRKVVTGSAGNISVLDVGCGTGILGMGAALFGAANVLGIDNDPEAIRVAIENVALNDGAASMKVTQTPLQDLKGSFDCIVANIVHDVLIAMKEDFYRLLLQNGDLILSGILHGEQEQNIIKQFEGVGFILLAKEQQEEWAALHLRKK